MSGRKKGPLAPQGPELLPSSGTTQYREALGSRGFATESADDNAFVIITRHGSVYGFRSEEPATGFVTIGALLEKKRIERYEPELLLVSAAAVMSAVPFVRILPDIEGGDMAFIVDALVSSPDHLARSVDRWIASIDEAGKMFMFALENVAEPPRRKNEKSTAVDTQVYRLKICLRDVEPAIWRRIEVLGDITFAQLHRALQGAMGWCDTHAHRFQIGRQAIGSADGGAFDGARDERRVRLSDVAKAKTKINYWYDFGDDWYHDVTVEAIAPPAKGQRYPRLVDGARSAPPEDVGGVSGYAAFLAVIADPAHPEHDEMLEWIGGSFDPREFRAHRARARTAEETLKAADVILTGCGDSSLSHAD